MAGVASGVSNGILSEQVEKEALTQWRSSEQLESGTPSTSPPFWDTDDDNDEDSGVRPSKLYKKYTWAINKFSQINKRELKSDEFEVGGYKWYILIYPQGCDVCNHLSLFLCVANHDKLLPGWSHFAQFTIAVDNKSDSKKAKQSDTLHRFWKKEHDWGWKKFMELSKVLDGFIQEDTLTIHAKVQVIREKADRLFRCLACDYRRELVGVYLNNVEGICRKFVDESRSKLGKLIEDKARWSSFRAFWLGIDQKSRRSMTRERSDLILRAIVKQFFVEKEVTSTLVMDSLYSGLKSLEAQIKTKKARCKLLGTEESQIPLVRFDQDMFVLVDDVLLLLERAALEPLPQKDDKGPQNHLKDENSGDESIKKANEQRLTELGRRTIEIYVLSHVFSKIEVAYQEAVALERQEELIREEAVWLETEQKSKRVMAEKEKKSKKKQVKQKRNNRKGKDKGRDDNVTANAMDKLQLESKDSIDVESKPELENPETLEDVSDSEERESSPVNWDAEAPSFVQNGKRESNNGLCIVVDDSSSTCSTDSVPSMIMNESLKANSRLPNHDSHKSPTREMNKRDKATSDISGWINDESNRPSESKRDVGLQNSSSGSRKDESELESSTKSLQDNIKKTEPQVLKKQLASHRTDPIIKDQADTQRPLKEKTTMAPSASISSSIYTPSPIQLKLEQKVTAPAAKISIKRPVSDGPHLTSSVTKSADVAVCSRSEPHKPLSPPKPYEKPVMQEVALIMSRPLSAPVVPGPRPTTPVVSMVQSQPLLLRSVSAVGRLSPDPTPGTHHHQSYRNAMMGTNILTPPSSTTSGFSQPQSPNAGYSVLQSYATPANLLYPPMFSLQQNDIHALDPFPQVHSRSHVSFPTESPACTSGRQSHGLVVDEFPHLDIINDLLDDEYGNGNFKTQHLNRQFSYPGDIGMANDMVVGPSTSSSGYQRTRSYHENGFQPRYSTHDFYPQPNLRPFLNGQMDGYVPNQWQVAGSDSSYLSSRISESGGYPYHNPDYSNLASNPDSYNMFRPSNGQ